MRIASLSFWHLHAADYADAVLAHPDLELVAVWDDDHARGVSAAERYGAEFVADLDAVLGDESIDGVIVCAPTSEHVALTTRALRAGKHVFIEKVLSDELAGAEQIVRAAGEADVALTVSLWRSDCGPARQIAALVSAGAVGRVTGARIRDGHPFALPRPGAPLGALPPQFWDAEDARGGILIDLCHPVYLLAMILGLPARVTAMFGQVTGRELEDNAAVILGYADGALAIAETSSVTRISPFSIEVHGTEGSIVYTEPGIGALVAERDGAPTPPVGESHLRLWSASSAESAEHGWLDLDIEPDAPAAIEQWYAHATTGMRGRANLDLALALSSVIEAAYTSARTASAVTVAPCD